MSRRYQRVHGDRQIMTAAEAVQQAPQQVIAGDLSARSKVELVQIARDLGINASSTWKPETIIKHIERVRNGESS